MPKPAFPSSCVRFSIPAGRHVILCPEAVVGDSGVLNDVRYTKRDLAGLRRLVGTSEEAKLATSCTSGVTDMSFLFKDASTFNQDISKWDTSSVSNMEGMFAGTTSFNQDIRWWNTAAVTNMRYMFDGARAFNQNLIYWNVERASCFGFNRNSRSWALNKPALPAYCLGFTIATNRVTMLCPDARVGDTVVINGAEYMKRDRAGLLALLGTAKEGDLAISCTTGVTDMSSLFKDASSFNVKIGSWDTSSVTTMQSMFNGASTFNQDISKWNTGKVTNMQSMFDGATSFNQDLSSWNVVKVGRSCTAFFGVSAGAWTLPKPALPASCIGFYLAANRVTVLCPDAAVGDVGVINGVEYTKRSQAGLRRLVGIRSEEAKLATSCTTGVTDMSFMFYAATSFDQDISKWDTGSVTTMASMFLHAASFNQDISKWDTSSVTTMNSMFYEATSFNQDLSSWNIDKVGSSCTRFETNAGAWTLPKPALPASCIAFGFAANGVTVLCPDAAVGDVGVVNGVEYTKRDRDGLLALVGTSEEAKLATSCTTGVTDMSWLFYVARSFKENIGSWDTSSVTTMEKMFAGATSFNQNIGSWDTSSVTTMNHMFAVTIYYNPDYQGAMAFNQDISKWNTATVTDMEKMFRGATSFNQDISGWNTAAVTNMQAMFYEATSFNQDISKWSTGSVTDMKYMFYGATGFDRDLSAWNVANVGSTCGLFDANAVKWSQPKPALPDSCIGFRIAANGVTVLCAGARVGDVGVVKGVTYTKRDRDGLRSLVGTLRRGQAGHLVHNGRHRHELHVR